VKNGKMMMENGKENLKCKNDDGKWKMENNFKNNFLHYTFYIIIFT